MDKIRLARPEDTTQILEIYRPHVLDTATSFETELPSISEFHGRIGDTLIKFPWLVYEIEKQVIGYAYAGPHRSRCAYGWSVESTAYVSSRHHGKGVGTKLYSQLFKLLKTQGAVNVFAGITQPNLASVRLHESLGFVQIGTFKDIGFKLGKWWDVGWWQLQLQKPDQPDAIQAPVNSFEIEI